MAELVTFVRQYDLARVRALLASKETDVNATCAVTVRHVEPVGTPELYQPDLTEVSSCLVCTHPVLFVMRCPCCHRAHCTIRMLCLRLHDQGTWT